MDHRRLILEAGEGGGLPTARMDLAEATWESPRWPSGIPELDTRTRGGFYGFSVIASAPKVGKTLIAIRSSALAAERGWRVIYLGGENADHIFRERLCNVWGGGLEEWPDQMVNWTGIRFTPGITFGDMVQDIVAQIDGEEENLLIVIDSLNRAAKYMAASEGIHYFRALERLVCFGQQVAEGSKGRVGVLGISELNRTGGAIGLDVEYAAACILYAKRAKKAGRVTLRVESRESGGGALGTFTREYSRCAFELEGSAPRLRVVRDGTDGMPQGNLFGTVPF